MSSFGITSETLEKVALKVALLMCALLKTYTTRRCFRVSLLWRLETISSLISLSSTSHDIFSLLALAVDDGIWRASQEADAGFVLRE